MSCVSWWWLWVAQPRMSLSLTSPPFRGALPADMTSLLLLQESCRVLHRCAGSISSPTSGPSQSLSSSSPPLPGANSLKIIRTGEGQLEGGEPQGRAEVQEEVDSWGFSVLGLLQKDSRGGCHEWPSWEAIPQKERFSEAFLISGIAGGTALTIGKKDSNTLLLEGTWSWGAAFQAQSLHLWPPASFSPALLGSGAVSASPLWSPLPGFSLSSVHLKA